MSDISSSTDESQAALRGPMLRSDLDIAALTANPPPLEVRACKEDPGRTEPIYLNGEGGLWWA